MRPNPAFQRVIDEYTPHIQELAIDTRIFLFETLPDLNEDVDESGNVIDYTLSTDHKGLICTMDLSKAGVKLGFYNGADLPDPDKILAGSALKYRYVEINDLAFLRSSILKDLILESSKAIKYSNKI
ncbi:MAG: hypothetical protein H7259_08990 [Cytophagales bacterium]|nr:hypothetical protein [Cytophaga sp.]